MPRWFLVLFALVLFSTGADAYIFGRSTGTVGTNTAFLPVYPGCDLLPSAPTGKQWYFDVAAGTAPSSGGTGASGAPYNEIRAIWGQNSGVNYTGWTHPLAANAIYKHSGSNTYYPDFGSSGNLSLTFANTGAITAGAVFQAADLQKFVLMSTLTVSAPGTITGIAVRALQPGVAGNEAPSTVVGPVPKGFVGTILNGLTAALDASGTTGGTATVQATGNLVLTVTAPGSITSQATFKAGTVSFMLTVPELDVTTPGTYTVPIIATAVGTSGNLAGSTALDPSGTLYTNPVLVGVTGGVDSSGLTGGQDIGIGSDPTHARLWPGDQVILKATGAYPELNVSSTSDQSEGGSYLVDNGASPVWITGDGSSTPVISQVEIGSFKGLIFDGIDVKYTNPQSEIVGSNVMQAGFPYGSVNPADGDTITLYDGSNVDVWTYRNTPSLPHDMQRGADALTSAQNAAAAMTANVPGGAATASFVSFVASGTVAATSVGISIKGQPGFPTPLVFMQAIATTTVGNETEPGTGLMQPLANASNNIAFHITGAISNPSANIGLHNVNIVTGPFPGTDGQIDDYPMTGSLGIDPTTGVVNGANVGGVWNNIDWLYQSASGFVARGDWNNLNGSNLVLGGTTCIAINGMNVKYSLNGFNIQDTIQSHYQNITLDYATQDGFESYSDNYIQYEDTVCRNLLQNGSGAHPDCMQPGTAAPIAFAGNAWHDLSFDRHQLYPFSDSELLSLTWPDFNGGTHTFITAATGILFTASNYYNVTVSNSLIYTHACNAIVAAGIWDSTFVGNTVLWDGFPTDSRNYDACSVHQANLTIGNSNITAGISPPYNLTLVNNVAGEMQTPGCGLGYTFVANYSTQQYMSGQVTNPTSGFGNCADDGTTYVSLTDYNTNGNSYESNGIHVLGATAVSSIYTAYAPPSSGIYTAANLNAAPLSTGPLWEVGTTSPPATTINVLGATRTVPPSPGAY